ncbi:ferritin-like protein [Kitasatospora sp. NPDC052896]|uniref:ferritin-like protein n=1 Tax=Kitasatospora sp. NPDC052896 TaxID=3364061 RepID=UPI0037C5C487
MSRRDFLASAGLAAAGPAVVAPPAAAAPTATPGATPGGAVARLLAVPGDRRDVHWIRAALQVAVELEFATIPPYLCAWWSVRDRGHQAARLIRRIVNDEMYHMGLACNLLVAVGGRPRIADAVPSYPGPLPGGVRPGLIVHLSGLTKEYVHEVLMRIETPETPLARMAGGPPSIGAFYTGLLEAFRDVRPELSAEGQLADRIGPDRLLPMESLDDVEQAIEIIKEQGEGTSGSPDSRFDSETPAHYYAFGEIYHEHRLRRVDGVWEFTGERVPFPEVSPMGSVPAGGWTAPRPEAERLLRRFDATFTEMLRRLEAAWTAGDPGTLRAAVHAMRAMEGPALSLMEIPLPDGHGVYGPQFRPVTT